MWRGIGNKDNTNKTQSSDPSHVIQYKYSEKTILNLWITHTYL